MKSCRLPALLLLTCCLALPAAARAAQPAAQRLIGIWQDDKDPENIIRFFPDHRVRIYVSRRDGQANQLHWINGRWQLGGGHNLTLVLNISANGGMSRVRKFTLQFSKQGLAVKSHGKVVGRQHRISEAALRTHLW